MIYNRFVKLAFTLTLSGTLVSCGDNTGFDPNLALNLDGYGNYPSEVGPIRDLGESEYKGMYLNDSQCSAYKVNSGDTYALAARELTGLFSGNIGFKIIDSAKNLTSIPIKNIDFTVTTRIQFIETCSSSTDKCTGSTTDTKENCCPDGYLSLEKAWTGKTDENGNFALQLQLAPEKWAFINNDGTTTKTEMDNLYFMYSGNLTLLKFEYDLEFKSAGLGSSCVQICNGLDFFLNDAFKASCLQTCSDGALTLKAPSVDLLNSKTHCPDKSDPLYIFGKFNDMSPKITQVKNEAGQTASVFDTSSTPSGN